MKSKISSLTLNLICPNCKGKLLSVTNGFSCQHCNKIYPTIDNIPCFINPDSFKEEVHQYEIDQVVVEKRVRLNFYLRSQISKILLEREFGENHLGVDLGVGGGKGENFEHIYSKVTPNLVGVDVSIVALGEFEKKFPGALGILADAGRLPFEDSSFDFVTASGLIHHIIGQQKTLFNLFKEVYRICKDGGIFIFNEPNLLYPTTLAGYPANYLLQKLKPGARGRVPYERAVHFFELKKSLNNAGFVGLGCEASSFAHRCMPMWLIDKIISKENSMKKMNPLKYFGIWMVVYGLKKS